MTKHSFRITKPVKVPQKFVAERELKPLAELLTKANADDGLPANNYNLFGEVLPLIQPTPKEIIAKFTIALIAKNITALASLLEDKGSYRILGEGDEMMDVTKAEYVKWIHNCLQNDSVTHVNSDVCDNCILGKKVVVYNGGSFPWPITDFGSVTKIALKFTIENGKITQIDFCSRFKNNKKQYGYEKFGSIYNAYINKGYSDTEAKVLTHKEWNM